MLERFKCFNINVIDEYMIVQKSALIGIYQIQRNVRFRVFWDVAVLLGFMFSIVSKENSASILKGYRVKLT